MSSFYIWGNWLNCQSLLGKKKWRWDFKSGWCSLFNHNNIQITKQFCLPKISPCYGAGPVLAFITIIFTVVICFNVSRDQSILQNLEETPIPRWQTKYPLQSSSHIKPYMQQKYIQHRFIAALAWKQDTGLSVFRNCKESLKEGKHSRNHRRFRKLKPSPEATYKQSRRICHKR